MDKHSRVPAPPSSELAVPGGESRSAERGGTAASGVACEEPRCSGKARGPEVGLAATAPGLTPGLSSPAAGGGPWSPARGPGRWLRPRAVGQRVFGATTLCPPSRRAPRLPLSAPSCLSPMPRFPRFPRPSLYHSLSPRVEMLTYVLESCLEAPPSRGSQQETEGVLPCAHRGAFHEGPVAEVGEGSRQGWELLGDIPAITSQSPAG